MDDIGPAVRAPLATLHRQRARDVVLAVSDDHTNACVMRVRLKGATPLPFPKPRSGLMAETITQAEPDHGDLNAPGDDAPDHGEMDQAAD